MGPARQSGNSRLQLVFSLRPMGHYGDVLNKALARPPLALITNGTSNSERTRYRGLATPEFCDGSVFCIPLRSTVFLLLPERVFRRSVLHHDLIGALLRRITSHFITAQYRR